MNLSDRLRMVINQIEGEWTTEQISRLLNCNITSLGGNITNLKRRGDIDVVRRENRKVGGKITIYKANKFLKLVNRKEINKIPVEVVKFTTIDQFLMMPAPCH